MFFDCTGLMAGLVATVITKVIYIFILTMFLWLERSEITGLKRVHLADFYYIVALSYCLLLSVEYLDNKHSSINIFFSTKSLFC